MNAYANLLPGINVAASLRPPPGFLFQGLIDMSPMVQNLPEDSMIYVRCCCGFCCLIVWAHVVLGLTVLIRSEAGEEKRFGTGPEQILIEQLDSQNQSQSSISLLDSSRDELFCIIPDPGEDLYPSIYLLRPAKGFVNFIFGDICSHRFPLASEGERTAVIEDLLVLTGSITALLCDKLVVDRLGSGAHDENEIPWIIPRHRLLEAARLLFDKPGLRERELESYKEAYLYKTFDDSLPQPMSLRTLMKGLWTERERKVWRSFRQAISHLSLYLMAFAHVENLQICGNVPLEDRQGNINSHALVKQIWGWDGQEKLLIQEGCWLNVFSHLLTGQGSKVYDPNDVISEPTLQALCSGRGWSAYISTIGYEDPLVYRYW